MSRKNLNTNFADLLSPIGEATFFAQYWEKKYLHIVHNDPNYLSSLLTLSDLDRVLSSNLLRHSDCRVARKVTVVDPSEYIYTTPKSMKGRINGAKIQSLFRNGSTIVYEGTQRWHPPLNQLCVSLFQHINQHSQCNVYVTPPKSFGFGAHFDTHDVLILQIHGRKKWSLYNNEIELPLPSQGRKLNKIPTDSEKYSTELMLEQGDILYIPRGLVHDAESEECTSVHITLGVFFYTWHQYFSDILKYTAENSVAFRRSLPYPMLTNMLINAKDSISDLLQDFSSQLNTGLAKHPLADEYSKRGVCKQHSSFSESVINAEKVSLNSIICVDNSVIIIELDDRTIALEVNGISLSFPIEIKDVLSFIISKPRFIVHELPSLDNSGKLVLSKRLILEGIGELS